MRRARRLSREWCAREAISIAQRRGCCPSIRLKSCAREKLVDGPSNSPVLKTLTLQQQLPPAFPHTFPTTTSRQHANSNTFTSIVTCICTASCRHHSKDHFHIHEAGAEANTMLLKQAAQQLGRTFWCIL